MDIVLSRFRNTLDGMGIIGELTADSQKLCYTYELPWKDNKRSVSCIPEGRYICTVYYSPTKRRCFHVRSVPNRSNILIHCGNNYRDTQGCILLGQSFDEYSVISSRLALGSVLIDLPDEFVLIIKNLIKE